VRKTRRKVTRKMQKTSEPRITRIARNVTQRRPKGPARNLQSFLQS